MENSQSKMENLTTATLQNDMLRMHIQIGEHHILADEPIDSGGEGTAPDPYELLSASLASCTLATLQLYLKRKDWNIRILKVDVAFVDEDNAGIKTAHFEKEITLVGTLDVSKRSRLTLISDACPVSKILKSSNNTVKTILSEWNPTKD